MAVCSLLDFSEDAKILQQVSNVPLPLRKLAVFLTALGKILQQLKGNDASTLFSIDGAAPGVQSGISPVQDENGRAGNGLT